MNAQLVVAIAGSVIALGLIYALIFGVGRNRGEFHIKGPDEYCPECKGECERMTAAERAEIKHVQMIHAAASDLEDRGFTIEQKVTDDYGCIGYVVSFVGHNYVLVAKEYAHKDKASFMARLVVQAPEEYDFIFYSQNEDVYTVFDGEYLRENADDSRGESKKRDCSWREISRSVGAELDNYVRGRDEPATLAGSNKTLDGFT